MTEHDPYPSARSVDSLDLDSMQETPLRSAEPETYPAPEPVYRDAEPSVEEKMAATQRGPVIPDNAPRPQDRKAKADPVEEFDDLGPVMDEATGILMVTVRHDGLTLSIPAEPQDWPIKATMAFEEGKVVSAIRGLLSPADFQAVLKKNYRNKEFGQLYDKLAKAGGFDSAGN